MDEQLHERRHGRSADAQARDSEAQGGDVPDLLDQPVLPVFGLSAVTIGAIFLGGALGTVARYLLEAHHHVAANAFPWVTLVVNLSGSLAIGFVVPLTDRIADRAPSLRPFVIIGILGGWTTYSTLAVDATLLGKNGDVLTCLAYLVATVGGGLALVVAGHDLGRRLVAR